MASPPPSFRLRADTQIETILLFNDPENFLRAPIYRSFLTVWVQVLYYILYYIMYYIPTHLQWATRSYSVRVYVTLLGHIAYTQFLGTTAQIYVYNGTFV